MPQSNDTKAAFGELLVANLTPQVQLTFVYNINPKIMSTQVVGSGTVTTANSLLSVSTGTDSNGHGHLESNRILRYGAGQGGLARFTAIFTQGVADSTQIIGIGDDLDGFFVGYDGTEFGILRRSAGVDHWTYIDDFDPPTRPSFSSSPGLYRWPLDPTKGNVYEIRYQWLGFGMIVFSAEDPNSGEFRPFHAIRYANTAVVPTIQNPMLPLAVLATNAGNTSDVVVKTASMMGAIEGIPNDVGTLTTADGTHAATTTEELILTLRAKDTFQGIRNRVESILQNVALSLDTGGQHQFRVYFGAVPTGPSYADIDAATSTLELDTTATAFTGGSLVFEGFVNSTSLQSFDVSAFGIRFRRLDTISITIQRITGSAGNASAVITLSEIF